MKYNISKNWINAILTIKKEPLVLLPFIIIAFLEGLALEFIYFFPRKPLSLLVNPIVKKFWGTEFLHYPGNLVILPKIFYYAQVVIYIALGVALTAIAINIFKNIKSNLPLKTRALVKNALGRLPSFILYGIIIIAAITFSQKLGSKALVKAFQMLSPRLPAFVANVYPIIVSVALFLSLMILQVFFVLILPLMVINKMPLFKALFKSIWLGLRNFFTLFVLLLVPYLIYFPVSLLKSFSYKITNLTFPEMNIYITVVGIALSIFIDCFVILCASQFVLDKETRS